MKKKKSAKKIIFHSEKEVPLMPMSIGSMLYNKTGAWRNIRPVIDIENCIQCGICYEYCKGCALCAEECPTKCIAMVEEEK